jgi:hypothetical protein
MTPMAISVVEDPNFSVIGPATIKPIGAKASEPNAS